MTTPSNPAEEDALGHELSLWVVLYHEAIARRLSINATEHKVLDLILREPGVTPGKIARFTGLSNAAVTKIIDRLVAHSYVERRRGTGDKRSYNIFAEPALNATMGDIYLVIGQRITEGNATFSPDELDTITRWLRMTIDILKSETHRLSTSSSAS